MTRHDGETSRPADRAGGQTGAGPLGELAGDGTECVLCGSEDRVHRAHFGAAVCPDCCEDRCADSTFGRGGCPGPGAGGSP